MYAEVEDLEARWRTLTPAERTTAETLLADAALEIDTACPPAVPLADGAARKVVSCRMVKRAMASPGGVGVESLQEGAGPFQQTSKYSNPMGDLYLTKADRRLLGCGIPAAFTVRMGDW